MLHKAAIDVENKCQECNFKCVSENDMISHMLTHNCDKVFACTECEYKCNSKGDVDEHMQIHKGILKISENKCPECDFICEDHNLEAHLLIVNGYKAGHLGYFCALINSLKLKFLTD